MNPLQSSGTPPDKSKSHDWPIHNSVRMLLSIVDREQCLQPPLAFVVITHIVGRLSADVPGLVVAVLHHHPHGLQVHPRGHDDGALPQREHQHAGAAGLLRLFLGHW